MSDQLEPDRDAEKGSSVTPVLALSAAVIFLGSAGSRVLGLVREQMSAGKFGAGDDIAAFTVADNLNTLLFDLFVNGMLQAAFVPVLALLAIGGVVQREHFRHVGGTLLVMVAVGTALVAAIGIVAAPALISLMTALDGDTLARGSETRQLAIDCTRLILLSLPMLAVAAVLTAMLYALQKPSGPALGALLRNAAVVVAILLVGDRMGVRSMAAGVVAGALLMVLLLFSATLRNDALPRIALDIHDPEVRKVAKLALPVLLGLLVSSGVVILDRNLAWGAEEDAVGAMRYATTLVQMVLGLVAAAVSIAALPRLAQAHAGSVADSARFGRELARSLALVTVLMIPAVAALGILATPIVRLLFEHGETDRHASRLIVTALLLYLPGHLLAAWDQVLIFAFYAQQNTILPVTVGIVSAGAYTVAALALVDRHGMAGLVAANSMQIAAHTVIMIGFGRKRFGAPAFAGLRETIARSTLAAAVMAIAGLATFRGLDSVIPDITTGSIGREVTGVVAPLLVCGVVYFIMARRLGLTELDDITAAMAAKFTTASRISHR